MEKEIKPILNSFEDELCAVAKLNDLLETFFNTKKSSINSEIHKVILTSNISNYHENTVVYFLYLIISKINYLFETEGSINKNNYFEKVLLDKPVKAILQRLGKGEYEVYRDVILINILNRIFYSTDILFSILRGIRKDERNVGNEIGFEWIISLLKDKDVQEFIGVNEFESTLFYSKENFDEFISWIFTISIVKHVSDVLVKKIKPSSAKHDLDISALKENITNAFDIYRKILLISHNSEYKLLMFIENLEESLFDK